MAHAPGRPTAREKPVYRAPLTAILTATALDWRGPPKDQFIFPAGENELLLVYGLLGPCGGARRARCRCDSLLPRFRVGRESR